MPSAYSKCFHPGFIGRFRNQNGGVFIICDRILINPLRRWQILFLKIYLNGPKYICRHPYKDIFNAFQTISMHDLKAALKILYWNPSLFSAEDTPCQRGKWTCLEPHDSRKIGKSENRVRIWPSFPCAHLCALSS